MFSTIFVYNRALFPQDEGLPHPQDEDQPLQPAGAKKMTPRRKMLATKVKKTPPAKKNGVNAKGKGKGKGKGSGN
jgi:hypothetical protein